MSHGVVMVTTSNRHPDDLYKNGIQREHFIPCIKLLKKELEVLNLNSETDYRKIPRPPSGVYHHPLDKAAEQHAEKWFEYLGDPQNDPPHPATHEVWGREIPVPCASGRAAKFSFQELLGRASGAADYLELVRHYDAFIVTDVPGMTIRERDWARRFITFIDAVYESKVRPFPPPLLLRAININTWQNRQNSSLLQQSPYKTSSCPKPKSKPHSTTHPPLPTAPRLYHQTCANSWTIWDSQWPH